MLLEHFTIDLFPLECYHTASPMKLDPKNRTQSFNFLPSIIEAGLAGNRQRLELLSLTAVRTLRASHPSLATQIAELMGKFAANTDSVRWHSHEPPPIDSEEGLALVKLESVEDAPFPKLDPKPLAAVTRFIDERRASQTLLAEGILPPGSLLLKGPPGTGKTMLARWVAKELGLKLVVLDLATAVSSLLGKTGSNLRRILDFARAKPCVLLLDEFDAIAKRRDDDGEIGELKRIVNVLLKELEQWPLNSVLIAATNHPELLDPAINRRFDIVVEIALPGRAGREQIMIDACGRFAEDLPQGFIAGFAMATPEVSGSEIVTMIQSAVRRHLVEKVKFTDCIVELLGERLAKVPKENLGFLICEVKAATGMSVRELGALFGKGPTTIQYHLNKKDTPQNSNE